MRYVFLLLSLLLVCLLCAHADEAVYTGTAFVVHPDGFLITCSHVVQGATDIQVRIGATSYKASVLQEDAKHDLALLQIGLDKLTPLPLANSNQVQLGEEVRACGYPLASTIGTDLKVTRGTISGITTIGVQKAFQVDAPINAGNSGGPLINEKGEVVGVVNAKLAAPDVEGVGFSVPINYARRLLELEGIEIAPGTAAAKLDGPTLVKRVSASIAFVKVTADEEAEPVAAGDALQAKRFELMDDAGKVRARLSMADGAPTLILYDDKGLNRAQFALGEDGQPAIILTDANDVMRAELSVGTDNSPNLIFNNNQGDALAMLTVTKENVPSLAMGNDGDHMTAQLCVSPDGFTELEMRDQNNVIRALMSVYGNGNSVISLSDKDANPRIWTRMKNETPLFGVANANGDITWSEP